jgi:hypothetical protein
MLGLCAVFLAAAVPTAPALASDTSATEAYLRANYQLVRVARANLGASIADYHAVLTEVRSRCPAAAAGSPQDSESTELSNEVIGAMVLSAAKPDRAAIGSFLRSVAGLRWSSGQITQSVSGYRTSLAALYRLARPDVCGDVSRWAATGFTSVPASTRAFDHVFVPSWVGLGMVPAGMSHLESAQGRQLAAGASADVYVLENAESQAVETWGDIMDALELNP